MGRKPLRGTTCSKPEEGADVTPSRQQTSRSVSLAAAGIGLERAAPAPGSAGGFSSAAPHRHTAALKVSKADTVVHSALSDAEHISLCETLDRVLNKGVVITGDILISVADVDLIWLGLELVLTSVETARRMSPSAVGVLASGQTVRET